MSVVFLRNRATANREAFAAATKSASSLILVDPGQSGDFEVLLHIGSKFCSTFPNDSNSLRDLDDYGFLIAPGKAVTVETAEIIGMPHNLYGTIVCKGRLAYKMGLIVPPTKIDPGFVGRLRVLVHNVSDGPYLLKRGDNIASAVFFSVGHTLPNLPRIPEPTLNDRRVGASRRARALIARPSTLAWIALLSALAALASTVIAALALTHPPATTAPPTAPVVDVKKK